MKKRIIETTIMILLFSGIAWAAHEQYFPNGIKAGTMIVDGGSITDSSGAISFGNENLTTTGTIEGATLTESSNAVPNSTDGLDFFAATTSAELLGVLSDETGTGAAVFANTPTLVTPEIGAATGTSLDASGQVDAGTLTIDGGSITDTSGAISFGNENLTTTGTLGAGAATVTTLNTGQGANELYDMDQNVLTASSPTFVTIDLTGVTDTNIPFMAAGASGVTDSPLTTDGTNVTVADGGKLITDEVRAYDAAGLKLYEDGGAGIFVQDSTGNVGIGTNSPVTTLDVNGSFALSITTPDLTGNTYTIAAGQYTVLLDDDDAQVTDTLVVTLPAAASNSGRILNLIKVGSSETVQLDGNSAETLNGALTKDLTVQYDRVQIQCDGSNWFILGSN